MKRYNRATAGTKKRKTRKRPAKECDSCIRRKNMRVRKIIVEQGKRLDILSQTL